MKTQTLQHFQTDGETWEIRAKKGKLPAVIDPGDLKGRKNLYIDILQKLAIQKAMGKDKAEIMLDFGCGSGRFSEMLAQRAEFLLGLEITLPMLLLAKEECSSSNCSFALFDGLNLPIKEGRADAIVSINVLQYITDESELIQVLSRVKNSLKPGGRFICVEQVTGNKKRWQRDYRTYLRLFQQHDFENIADYPIRKGHFLWLYPIYLGLVPQMFFNIIAKLEMFLRKILWHSVWDYQDHLFVMKRRS
jgi:SAM-dependent methyltransferase